jgi:hypothetical protein
VDWQKNLMTSGDWLSCSQSAASVDILQMSLFITTWQEYVFTPLLDLLVRCWF